MYRVAIIAALLLPAFCLADTIVFKNGQELEGKVLEQDETSIVVEVEYGKMRISKDKIERITPDTPEKLAKRELERKTAQTAATKTDDKQPAINAKLADAAKAIQKKAKTAAPAPAPQVAAQPAQPSWADQYIQYRRTMHNQENKATNDLRTARQRSDRQSLLTGDPRNISNQVNTGNPLRAGSTGRSRLPSGINQLPDIAKKYIGGM